MRHAMNWGAVLGLLLIMFSVTLYLLGMSESNAVGLTYGLMIGVICYGIVQRRKHQEGFITYGEGLATGTAIAFFGGIISAFYAFIHMSFIDTEQLARLLVKMEDQLFEQGLPTSQVDMMMGIYEKIFKPVPMFFMTIISSAFTGFIISLIAAAVFKKNDESFEANFK
ncbi:MAG: DUF4199 domain-containing protein [Flavobacteriales bacterium]|nr:DUF4199 domain-containing protein [Flavobacteriales bacterium]